MNLSFSPSPSLKCLGPLGKDQSCILTWWGDSLVPAEEALGSWMGRQRGLKETTG